MMHARPASALEISRRSATWAAAFLAVLAFLLAGCTERKRPYGYLRVARVNEIQTPAFLEADRLYVRRDAGGFYAMSTMCTYDLSPLKLESRDGGVVFRSAYTDSLYDGEGKVLHGPAKVNLPYYKLQLEPYTIKAGEPVVRDTLYVLIGEEVGPEWRLKIE